MRHYPPTLREEDPEEPGQPGTEERKRAEPPVAELESRLLKGRKIMIFGQVTDKLARDVVARILALAMASDIRHSVRSGSGWSQRQLRHDGRCLFTKSRTPAAGPPSLLLPKQTRQPQWAHRRA